jgi:peptidylprolyl isomerase domain and WD repeat-containing protein 1
MHRDTVTHVEFARGADFLCTASKDGFVKFWKKTRRKLEFVKQFQAHLAPVRCMRVSVDGHLLATAGGDGGVKVFDVQSFDMIHMLQLPYIPLAVEWVHAPGRGGTGVLAVSDVNSPLIRLYAADGGNEPAHTLELHAAPVTLMRYNAALRLCISCDEKGGVEYWDTSVSKAVVKHYIAFLCV